MMTRRCDGGTSITIMNVLGCMCDSARIKYTFHFHFYFFFVSSLVANSATTTRSSRLMRPVRFVNDHDRHIRFRLFFFLFWFLINKFSYICIYGYFFSTFPCVANKLNVLKQLDEETSARIYLRLFSPVLHVN